MFEQFLFGDIDYYKCGNHLKKRHSVLYFVIYP